MYKLLLVDDEEIERDALRYIVQNSGLDIGEVREAANGHEAIATVAEFMPDIVILDIKMPGMNGIDVGHIIKKIKPDIKIVFMTAFDKFEYAKEAIKIGVEEFIVKPAPNDRTIEVLQACILKLEEEKRKERQKEDLEVKINKITDFLENEFVNSVVNGEIDEKQAVDYLKFMLNEFVEGFGVVIEMEFAGDQRENHLQRNLIKKRFTEQLSHLLDGSVKFMMSLVKDTVYILVFGYPKDRKQTLVRTIEDEIRMTSEVINEQMEAEVYYGFGEGYGQISMLWKSFAQAKAASRNRMLEEVENCDRPDPSQPGLAFIERELCMSIINEDKDEMIKKADHILDNIIYATNDINASRLQLYEFFVLLNRYMNKESQLKHAIPDYLFNDLKNIESRGEAKNYIHRYLLGIFKEIEEQNANKTTALLDKAVDYINSHYDEGITLDDVAYEVGFSTYYFGKIFKKTYKVSFAEYLANIRVEKAKELLEDPQLSIKDITYRVGYMDPNYFTRIFKKSVGITPSEYRSKID